MSIANIDFTGGARLAGVAGRKPPTTPNVPLEALKAYQQLTSSTSKALGSVPRSNVDLAAQIRSFSDFSKPVKRKPGLLQQILGAGPIKYALKPLEIIDVPRRILISGLKEGADALGSGDASWSDFIGQAKDPTFGVGRFVDTGNKWLDRVAGFAGDVLLDPTTYITLGAGKFAGLAGRQALASRLAAKGATEELVQKAGRLGITALSSAERELAGVAPAGLRFMGKRISGTERLAEGIGTGLASTRAAIGSTKAGGALRRARTPEEFAEFIEKLATGRGPLTATQAATTLDANIYRKGTQGRVLSEIVAEFEPLRQKLNASGRSKQISAMVEKGDLSDELADEVFQFLQKNRERMQTAGIDVGKITDEAGNTAYVPHVWSAQGRELLMEESPFAADFFKAFNLTKSEISNPAAVRTRKFVPDPTKVYNIGGKKLVFEDATIEGINKVFRREFGFNVLEDDAVELIKGYSNQVAKAIGNKAFEDRLVTLGTARAVSEVSEDVVDKKATKAAKKVADKEAIENTKKAKAAAKVQKKVVDDARKEYRATVRAAVTRIRQEFKGRLGKVDAKLKNLQNELDTFLTANAADAVDLGSQARAMDNVIREARAYVDEAVAKRERFLEEAGRLNQAADVVENSPIYRELQDNIEYAQRMVDETTALRTELDDVARKIDETVLDIPTPTQLGDEVEKALNKPVSLYEGTNVQPYRAGGVVPGTRAYDTSNALHEFAQSYDDAARTVGLVSPEAQSMYAEAGQLADKAENMRIMDDLEEQLENIPFVKNVHAMLESEYQRLYRKFVDKTGNPNEVAYGSLNSISVKQMNELGFTNADKRLIAEFDANFVKFNSIDDLEQKYLAAARRVEDADGMQRKAVAIRTRAKAKALEDFRARLDRTTSGQAGIPTVGDEIKNRVVASFERMLDAYEKSIPTMRSYISTKDLSSARAVALAKDSIGLKMDLTDAAMALRIQYDFIGRYSAAVDKLRATGVSFNPDAVAAKAGRNAIAAEINRAKTNLNELLAARVRIIRDAAKVLSDGTAETATVRTANSVARKTAAERELVNNVQAYTEFVRGYLDEYLKQKKLFSDAQRGKKGGIISAEQLQEMGFDIEDLSSSGALGSVGFSVADGEGGYERMGELRKTIVLAIFGETAVREKFNFNDFLKQVTTRGTGKGRPVEVDIVKLNNWMLKNAVPGLNNERVLNRIVEEGKRQLRNAEVAPTVAGAIGEQIGEMESRILRLQQSAKRLGYRPRNGRKLTAQELERVEAIIGKGLDFDDPVSMGEELARLNERIEKISSPENKKLRKELLDEEKMLKDFLSKIPQGTPSNRILKGGMTKAGAQQRLSQVREFLSMRVVKSELEQVDDDIAAVVAEMRALGGQRVKKEGIADPMMRRRFNNLKRERDGLRNMMDDGQLGAPTSEAYRDAIRRLEELDLTMKKISETNLVSPEGTVDVFTGSTEAAARLNKRLETLRNRKFELEAELDVSRKEAKFLQDILDGEAYTGRKLGLPAGKAQANWQSVVFGESLGRVVRGFDREFVRNRIALYARELELQNALSLPNQSILTNQVREIDDVIAELGTKEQVIARIEKLGREEENLKKVASGESIYGGYTVEGAQKRLRQIPRDRKKLQASLANIEESTARRRELTEAIAGGREFEAAKAKKAADDAAQPFTDSVAVARERAQQTAEAGESQLEIERPLGELAFQDAVEARKQIQTEIDNTKQVAIDANVEFQQRSLELRTIASEIENQIRAAQMGNAPKRVEELSTWLDGVYALYDPIGYQARVGAEAAQGNNLAAQIMRLQTMPDSQDKYVVLSLLAQAHKQEANLLLEEGTLSRLNQMVDAAKKPDFPKIMKQQLIEGWQALPGNRVAVPTEVSKAMERFMRIDAPSEWRQFTQMWQNYTDFFKAYATLSPRFHIRNALSASLMNYADGVATRNAVDGVKYWKLAKADPENWWKSLPAEEQRLAGDAILSVYAAGVGQYAEFGAVKGTRNRVVTASRNIGTDVEGGVRMGMALDTLRNGGDVVEAAQRIKRIHFDYSDVSKMDKIAKRVIPFWTFMSRNIPLQMQQIWLKPRVYQIYSNAVRNFQGQPTGEITPSWYSESDMFRSPVGGGYLRPDLAWSGLESQVRQATTARGLVSQANPMLRIPFELASGQKAFTGAQLSEGEAPMYALEGLIPFLNTARSLTGTKPTSAPGASEQAQAAGAASGGQAQLNAILSFLGLPYVQPTVSQQRGEILRRQAQLEELLKKVGQR